MYLNWLLLLSQLPCQILSTRMVIPSKHPGVLVTSNAHQFVHLQLLSKTDCGLMSEIMKSQIHKKSAFRLNSLLVALGQI